MAATWPCCSGRVPTAATGMMKRASRRRAAATWLCCSGRAPTAATGTPTRARRRRKAATWPCCSGCVPTAACDWDAGTCVEAARNGHLDVLEWARANGCPEHFGDEEDEGDDDSAEESEGEQEEGDG